MSKIHELSIKWPEKEDIPDVQVKIDKINEFIQTEDITQGEMFNWCIAMCTAASFAIDQFRPDSYQMKNQNENYMQKSNR